MKPLTDLMDDVRAELAERRERLDEAIAALESLNGAAGSPQARRRAPGGPKAKAAGRRKPQGQRGWLPAAVRRVLGAHKGKPVKASVIRDALMKREAKGKNPASVLQQIYTVQKGKGFRYGPEGIRLA
jgi:hypothetical protein